MKKARKHKVLLSFVLASLLTLNGVASVSAAVPTTEQVNIENDSTVKQARTSNETLLDWKNGRMIMHTACHPSSLKCLMDKNPSNKFEDLEMLKPLLHDKRIVFLGESSHGVAQFNLAKTRLIQFYIRKWAIMSLPLKVVWAM